MIKSTHGLKWEAKLGPESGLTGTEARALTLKTNLELTVLRRTVEAEGIVSFDLGLPDGAALPPYEAGAHIEVSTPAGFARAYSLCGEPGRPGPYRIAVLRSKAEAGSSSLHDSVHEGNRLRVSRPRNHFALDESATHSLLIAGGIGITPLLSMAHRLRALDRAFSLHYTARTPAHAAFTALLASPSFAGRAFMHHSAADGRLDLDALLTNSQPGRRVYVCGPAALIDAVRATARRQGWADEQVRFEHFQGSPASSQSDEDFHVVLHSSGAVIKVARSQSVSDALRAHGVAVPTSCEQGVCGTCLTRVLEGEVDHRDLYLTPQEQAAQNCFLPCCSRAKSSSLLLDL